MFDISCDQGWVSGYFAALLVVVIVWRPAAEGDGAGLLLIVSERKTASWCFI